MSVQQQNRLSGARDTSGRLDVTARCRDFTRGMIDDHPLAMTLGAFGLGLGLGAMIGGLLGDQRSSHSRHAEALGHRVLRSVKEMLPDRVSSYVS